MTMTCTHSLLDLVGYEVRLSTTTITLASGERVGQHGSRPLVVATFESATEYAQALAEADRLGRGNFYLDEDGAERAAGVYAVIDNVYACGCTSREV